MDLESGFFMKVVLSLLSSGMLLLSACSNHNDGSTPKEQINVVYGKTFVGHAGAEACGITISWNEAGIEEARIESPNLAAFAAPGMPHDAFNLVRAPSNRGQGRTGRRRSPKNRL